MSENILTQEPAKPSAMKLTKPSAHTLRRLCLKMGGDGAPAPSAPRSAAQRDIFQRWICRIFRPLNGGGNTTGAASLPKNSVFVPSPLRLRAAVLAVVLGAAFCANAV